MPRGQGAPVGALWGGLDLRRVPQGPFVMGSHDGEGIDDDEKPRHEVDIPYHYWMARTPVTRVQFAAFVRETGYRTTSEQEGWAWVWSLEDQGWVKTEGANWRMPWGPDSDRAPIDSHPVVSVSFHDARAYCEWLASEVVLDLRDGFECRVPSEAEWEKAARGPGGRVWPWGDHFDPALCTFQGSSTDTVTEVGSHAPRADSVYGISDMAGNVWEWTTTLWGNERSVRSFVYPYRLDDGRDDQDADDSFYRIIRGGSFKDDPQTLRAACRDLDPPRFSLNNLGMRIVVAPCGPQTSAT